MPVCRALRERFEQAHRERYGYADPDGRPRDRQPARHRHGARAPGAEPAARASRLRRGARPASRTSTAARSTPRCSAARPDAGERLRGPGGARARGGDGRRAARMDRDVRRARRRAARPGRAINDRAPRPGDPPGDARRPQGCLRRDGGGTGARGPLGQHQGAPGRLDRPVRRAGSDGHAGRAHSRAPRRDAGRRRRRARRASTPPGDTWILNDPYHGGTHLPDITLVSPLFRRRTTCRLRRDAGSSRRRGRRGAGQHAGALPAPRAGGRRDPSDAPCPRLADRRRDARLAGRADARSRASASQTCARSSRPTASPRCASESSRTGTATSCSSGRWRRCCSTPSAARGRRSRRCRTGATAHPTCWRTTAAGRRTTSASPARCSIAGDELTVDFAGTDPQSDGNLNCPLSVTKSAVTTWCAC